MDGVVDWFSACGIALSETTSIRVTKVTNARDAAAVATTHERRKLGLGKFAACTIWGD
eukprot:COSAG01_NODE_1119_length_11633_cov_4.612190_4_plen_58_part_00